ncbi:hypothetical protein KOW79_001201 [Hemibagrus wyckioides]|uniref:Uncharacterized protein n=1 Tax=Hemibagrus wyckioides TaxID=337641 RepID=A0A9D3P7R6_9TELE|nr:hypothetical protein KOW79_001201 [Hemibagrus wyckioides]
MGNSQTHESKISEERRSSRCGPAGVSTPDPGSDQRQRCFRDILDLVLQLSDEEWKAVSRDMEKEVSRFEFVAACTKIVTTVSSAVVRRLMIPLSESFGIEAILEANDKLKKMAKLKLSKCSSSDASAQSSPMEASDFICELSQRIVTEIKSAMLEAIRSMASGPRPSCSARASSPAGDLISPLDDLSIACTNEICERILALYHSEEGVRPRGETSSRTSLKSHQEVNGIMKGLEEVVSISRSSSWFTVSSTVSSTVTSTPEPEVMTPDDASSPPQAERPFSEQFLSKASQAISEVLLKTEQKVAASVLPQTSTPASTELNFLIELVKSTATEILQKLFFILVQSLHEHLSGVSSSNANQSGPEHEQMFLSDAQTIHMDIHKQVFTFICERQQAVLEKRNCLLDVCSVAASELDVSAENTRESAADELFLEATNAASDILEKTLSSHDSTVKSSGSSTVTPLMEMDLDHVVSDIVNKVINGVALEVRKTAMKTRQEAQVCDADLHSAPDSKSSSGFSALEKSVEQVIDAERKPLPSAPNRSYISQHFFTVVRDRLKAFFTSLTAADDKSDEDQVVSIYISEDGMVHELKEPDVSQNLKDPFLEKSYKILKPVHFPSDFIDKLEEEQNVLFRRTIEDLADALQEHLQNAGQDLLQHLQDLYLLLYP